ncbi:amphiphysin isoform X3 [Neolamprologus brichardi]|uniref:amphiphysin isoform X3 n=1 Tax=Neolamprologus brichardi TaxID=32507 RepID=UPI0003EBF32D|nr:amphiphysin isoform X3 [Neolamprologus brichardi]
MAEIKTGIFAKNVQKRLNRAQEKVLQKLGKADETKDEQFEQVVINFRRQESEGSRLQREMKAYMSAIKGMQQASINLTQSLHEVYEPDWHGKDDVLTIGKDCDALWEDFHNKLVDSTLLNLDAYLQQFPDLKTRVAKRSRKLIDYDSARHHMETMQTSGMKNDRKMIKAEEELKKAQKVFDELNIGLQEELPTLWDRRVGFYISTFKSVTSLEAKFHREISLVCRELYEVMTQLREQHSDKIFTIQGAPSDSGPLRLARTPSPPEDESPPDSPDLSTNHMLRPISPGPPRPKSPMQLKKGPPVPPPPKVTPTKEVVEEQIIDLFGGEFLPAPSPSQPNERPGESLLDLDFDAFQPDESVSPVPQTAVPWDMWSANNQAAQPAADTGFVADWSADFGSVSANGEDASGAEEPAILGGPTVGQEGAQEGVQGETRGWPQGEGIQPGGESTAITRDSEITPAEDEVSSWESQPNSNLHSSLCCGEDDSTGQADSGADELRKEDRRKSTPGLIFTNEYGEQIEEIAEDRGDKWSRSPEGSGSEYETAEEWGDGGQGGGWASADDELSYDDRTQEKSQKVQAGGDVPGDCPQTREVVSDCSSIAAKRNRNNSSEAVPERLDLYQDHCEAEGETDERLYFSETQGGAFDFDLISEKQGGGTFDSDLLAETRGGGAFDSDPFAETQGGGASDSDLIAETQGGGAFDSDPFAETQGGGAFDSDPVAETHGGGASDSDLIAETQGGGAFDSDPFAETHGGAFDSYLIAETQGGGVFDSDPFAITQGGGAFDSDPFEEKQGGGAFDSDPFAETKGGGAFDSDPFAETRGGGAFDSDPFAKTQEGGAFDSDLIAETQGGAFDFDPFPETQGEGAFDSELIAETKGGGAFDSDPFEETQGGGAFDSDPSEEKQGGGAFDSDPFTETKGGGAFDSELIAETKGGGAFDPELIAETKGGGAFDSDPFEETQGGGAFDSDPSEEKQGGGAFDFDPFAETKGGGAFDSDPFEEKQGGGAFDSDPFAQSHCGDKRGGFEFDPFAETSKKAEAVLTGDRKSGWDFSNSFPAISSGTGAPASSNTSWQEGSGSKNSASICGTAAAGNKEVKNPRIHKEPENSDMSEDEAANRRFGKLYQELDTEKEEDPSFFADFDKMNEGNSESNDALEAAEAQAAGSREPAAEDKPPSLTTGGEQDECPPLLAGEEPVSSTAGAEMEEPPAPPAGEVEESGAAPAGQDDTDTRSDSLKEEKPASTVVSPGSEQAEIPPAEQAKTSPSEAASSENMPIPSVVIEPASSNEGDDDRDADIISPTTISDNGVTTENQNIKHISPSGGASGLPDDFLYKVETIHDFEAANSDELDLKRGDVVLVVPTASVEDQDAGWLTGIKESDWLTFGAGAQKGLFPENFTQHLE